MIPNFIQLFNRGCLILEYLGMQLFAEGKSRIACLLQNFWLKKNEMDLHGLLTVEHEVYLNKIEYRSYFIEHRPLPEEKLMAKTNTT
jgi:hypothetical protein